MYGMGGGTPCILLSLLPEVVNTFTNGLRFFTGIGMVTSTSDELWLLSWIIWVFCLLNPFAGFILVSWELSGTGRLLHKKSKLWCSPRTIPVPFNFMTSYTGNSQLQHRCPASNKAAISLISYGQIRGLQIQNCCAISLGLSTFCTLIDILRGNMICFLHAFLPLYDICSVGYSAFWLFIFVVWAITSMYFFACFLVQTLICF